MEAVSILENKDRIDWKYDEDADVLYLSIGEPTPALGVDIGDGVVLRYDERRKQVVGLTVFAIRKRLLQEIGQREDE
ncbi:MAG: DUF2283 domain-containing protein [Candidatus Hydrogenedentota bacterium]